VRYVTSCPLPEDVTALHLIRTLVTSTCHPAHSRTSPIHAPMLIDSVCGLQTSPQTLRCPVAVPSGPRAVPHTHTLTHTYTTSSLQSTRLHHTHMSSACRAFFGFYQPAATFQREDGDGDMAGGT
jgi:hypothetical protein